MNLTDIREGLAANLRALVDAGTVKHVSPWLLDNPTMPSVCVAGVSAMEFTTFQPGDADITLLVEAAIGKASDVGAQKILDKLLAGSGSTSLRAAVEADPQLTSRWNNDDGLTENQPAACDDLQVVAYRGQQRFTFPNGVEALLATWEVQVIT